MREEADYQTKIEEIIDPVINAAGVRLLIAREDLNHPLVSGNKLRKLKYNLQEAKKAGHQKLLTLGGAYSNHIHATAAAAKMMDFEAVGVIRGEEHLPLNPTLQFAQKSGMQLEYLDREMYRQRDQPEFLEMLQEKFGDFYFIPEGGSNHLAVKGCQEIIGHIRSPFDYIITASGTGGTLAGLISGLSKNQKAIGVSVLKDGSFLYEAVDNLLDDFKSASGIDWEIATEYHFNGYAKYTDRLIRFINNFKAIHKVPLDPIYTGKMMYAVWEMIKNGKFERGSTIVALHTGGLQGIKGFNHRYGKLIK